MKALKNLWRDYQLGRIIRERGVSVMRLDPDISGGDKWSACDSRMDFDYGHNGRWGGGRTPLDAAREAANLPRR